jgi:hypothetical protein
MPEFLARSFSKPSRRFRYREDTHRDESRRDTQECVPHEGCSRPVSCRLALLGGTCQE